MKSMLSSFKGDFNRTITVYPLEIAKNSVGEVQKSWDTPSTSGIKCLLLLEKKIINAFVNNEVEFIKTSHMVRLGFGPVISVGDKIKDENDVYYEVKFVYSTPGFNGDDDHLLLYADIIT